jgi:hypothetical protein
MMGAPRLLAVLLALSAAPPAAGAPAEEPARVSVTAVPPALRLGEGQRAVVRITGLREAPALAASVGHLEGLRLVAPGVHEAEFVPPDASAPQMAFVTVLGRRGWGFVAIPLSGVRDVSVSARYGTAVTVTVAGEEFGPVPADARGRAVVRVAVPPGVRHAMYRAQRLDLAVEDAPLVHVLLDQAEVDANLRSEVRVRALVVDERGQPRAKAPLTLEASAGALGAPVEAEPGVLQARWRVEPGQVGEARVTARVAHTPASVAAAVLRRVAGAAQRITIGVDRERVVAGADDELAVTADLADAGGNPAATPAGLVVSPGTVLEWERAGAGRWAGRVQVPRSRGGRQELALTVVTPGKLSATRKVALAPGPARALRVVPAADLEADGGRHELHVAVVDGFGNRVDVSDAPSLTAARGGLGAPARYASGAWRLEYRAPLARDDYRDLVEARVGALTSTAHLRVRGLRGGVVLAPKVGYTASLGGLRSLSAGGEVGLWGRSLGLVLEGRFFRWDQPGGAEALQLRSEATFVALDASLAWRRPVAGGMLWLGGGGSAVASGSRVSVAGQPALGARSWVPGAHASVSVGWRLGFGIPFAEVKGAWQGDPGRGALRGSIESLTLSAGYRFDVL